ncbi:Protein toll like protein [Argiope bruennichi]|uniref:Protein toll like protein n=1 Tax=Argiope bruennichi TaxID=94029 RepID=A0A8T0FAT4_ARGBR|nr:Protein toll like protein [Argiope bruennichi]
MDRYRREQASIRTTDWNLMRVSGRISTINNRHFSLRKGRHPFENLLSCLVLFLVCLHVVLSDLPEEDTFPKEKCETALPECQCEDYMDVVGLICRNVKNFETFSRTLSDGSVFEVNTTYEIVLKGIRVLPRQFLKGLIVQRLFIDDIQTEVIEDGAFDGMLQLKKFQVKLSSIKEIPDFRPVSSSLKNLILDNSRLTSISGNRLQNLPNLETVSFVNNSIQSVASDAFQGTNNLIIFDLSCNQLKALPPKLLNPWKKLNKLALTSNQLLYVDQLFAVTHPKFIYLDHNNLTDLDSILHPNMPEVQTLLLSYNPLSKITENSFNGKVNNARFLYLDHCLIREFNASHFKDLALLSTLDLSYNLIEKVDNQTIKFGSGVELHFTGNKITEFNVDLTYRVKHVYLNKNLLTSVARTLRYSQLFDVNMADNRIETLGPQDFHGVHGIQNINLQGNLISKVDSQTFKGIRRDLTHLDLSRNQIRSLQGCVRDLYLLVSLNLTGNKIESFEEGEFIGLEELLELYLDGNLLTTLGNEIQLLIQLQHLIISNNRITTIEPDQIPHTLKFLYLDGNPFKCDCQLLPFLEYLNSSSVGTDGPLCTLSNQTSQLPPTKCPDGCNCSCTQNKDKRFMSVDCSSAELTELPPLFTTEYHSTTKENCSSIVIHLPRNTQFSQSGPFVIEDEIRGLNLSHNKLKSLEDADLPGGMSHLFLSNNLLHKPPLSLLYSLEKLTNVTFSGNPWSCDCDLLSFKGWILYKSEIVADGNDTRCGAQSSELNGRVIWSLTDMDLCPVSTAASTSLIIGLCFLLAVSLVIIVLIVHWTKVRIWLFAHGVTCFQNYDAIQNKESENLLQMNGLLNEQRGTEHLVSFPLPDDNAYRQEHSRIGAEFHGNGGSLFQEQPADRASANRYISVTSQSKLPM